MQALKVDTFGSLRKIESTNATAADQGSAHWPLEQTLQHGTRSFGSESHLERCSACNGTLDKLGICEPCLYRDLNLDDIASTGNSFESSLKEWDDGISYIHKTLSPLN